MTCAYIFAFLAIFGFPTGPTTTPRDYVAWVSQTFIQLVMLSVLMVGQNVLAAAADRRSQQTYDDVEVLLHELMQVQEHLRAQDEVLVHGGSGNEYPSEGEVGGAGLCRNDGGDRDCPGP